MIIHFVVLLHHLNKLLKVNGAIPIYIDLHDEAVQLVLCGVLTHGSQHGQQLHCRDEATPILTQKTKLELSAAKLRGKFHPGW